jgi:pimeloyl-ACP methyl ester carboxylesterase
MLAGRLFGSGRVGVVLAHMLPSDATSWYPAARKMAAAGYLALAFNFRGYDGSQGSKNTAGAPKDLKAARDMIIQQGAQSIVLVGASTGATAAIAAAPALDPLAIVAISPPLRFAGLDAVVAAGHVQRPVLLMASRDDQPAMSSLETLSRALPNADTKVFDGGAHGTNLLQGRPEAVGVLIAFLQRYAPTSPPPTLTG